jgi:sugar O-acyltransferase (sialic acid O-acetyltransferase NeuD family)
MRGDAFMNRPLFIIGCGGFGREFFVFPQALSTASGPWDIAGFVDDKPSDLNRCLVSSLGSQYVGTVAELSRATAPFRAVVAIGSPATRVAIVEKLTSAPVTYPTLIHPSCTIGSAVTMVQGTIIAAGARLSTNITVGRPVHVDQNAIIGDDCEIGEFARINPHVSVSGPTRIGERTVIGAGSVILQRLSIGDDCIVGVAALVVKAVPAGRTVMGVPAR